MGDADGDNGGMSDATQRLRFLSELAGAFGGLALGTASICQQVGEWGLLGWVVSVVSTVRLLSANRSTNHESLHSIKTPPLVLRVLIASVAVFCIIFLFTMSLAVAADPEAPEPADAVAVLALGTVGIVSFAASVRMIRK
jgi:hypothetical protein